MRACPNSLDGRHHWAGGDAALGNPRAHCVCCEEDGDIGDAQVHTRGPSVLALTLWLVFSGVVMYAALVVLASV